MTGFLGECWQMARYTGFIMATRREGVWDMVKPWMCSSRGTGLTFGWKLNSVWVEAPSH